MFKYKSEAELTAMTPEQRDVYAEQKRAYEADLRKKEIADALKELPPPPAGPITEAQVKQIVEDLNILKEGQSAGLSAKQTLVAAIKENKAALAACLKSSSEVVLKAAVGSDAISDNPNQMMLPGIGQLLYKARSLYNLFRKINFPVGTHNGTIKYIDWDEATTVKAAAMVAEGDAFPESTAKFKTYSTGLKKIGDTLPVYEEFFEDEVMAAAELEMFISNNVESKVDQQIANGDGTGDNLTGLVSSAIAFVPVASGIVDANIFDLITKMTESITVPAGAKYQVDFAAMSTAVKNKLVLKKDEFNNYMFPPNHPIYSLIVEDNSLDNDTLIVGDSRFGAIYEMGGVLISRGFVNAQFTEDSVTLKARKRLLFLVRNSDKSGFRKVTGLAAALTTLAS